MSTTGRAKKSYYATIGGVPPARRRLVWLGKLRGVLAWARGVTGGIGVVASGRKLPSSRRGAARRIRRGQPLVANRGRGNALASVVGRARGVAGGIGVVALGRKLPGSGRGAA